MLTESSHNILITGAGGFIGRSLVSLLVNEGKNVHIATRNKDKDVRILQINNVDYKYFDLGKEESDFSSLFNDIDVVIHLAAHVHINNIYEHDKNIFNRINVKGTRELALAAANKNVKRFIYLSTAKVYGEKSRLNDGVAYKFTEQDLTMPGDIYSNSKLQAEKEIKMICSESEMDFVILRPPLVYGPFVKANFLSLMKIIERGYPLPLASVQNLRSLVYVENLVHAILTSVNSDQAINNIFNISDIDISVPGLVRKIAGIMGIKPVLFRCPVKYLKLAGKLFFKSKSIDRLTESFVIDSTLIRNQLQWYPPYNFDHGLKKTVDWYMGSK